jgi:DNA processing protein
MLAPYLEQMISSAPGSPPRQLLTWPNEELVKLAAPKIADYLLTKLASIHEDRMRDQLAAANCWACCKHSDHYPLGLRDLPDAPWALIGRGDATLLPRIYPARTIAIVGARRATSYGREVARELGRELAAKGFIVVSGLAFGIDGCAHRGALDEGRTVAVMACGPDTAYPASHRTLWRRIAETGVVLSELPPGATPWCWTFPARNRIVAGLAGMTVVVEASERSGSMLAPAVAADIGREVGAVPGPLTSRASAGPNALLAAGARVVRDAQDIADPLAGVETNPRSGGDS